MISSGQKREMPKPRPKPKMMRSTRRSDAAFHFTAPDGHAVLPERIVAMALLTQQELSVLGKAFDRAWPIEDAPSSFDELLRAIDEADRRLNPSSIPQRH